jgi:hypothetical protein
VSRTRDDRRRNMRGHFAMNRADDGGPVGSFTLGYGDGCYESFHEDGTAYAMDRAESHEPGSHDEMVRLLVEPRRLHARQARGVA